ncbi:glycine--tRNA ligase subunit beta [Desulfovibrio ferrophilus]|uniref:Glycine--tRNA ligase beta subunit n=1 Tax=Desulfovibrio ferrophilus TaxID=241368 RepID=A0A2Z6AWJ4_9BACT|nr:glycine--tRNA ligase subunit beta [Desulfovibrio ferrophilus]BBD07622.1 glycine--tRNA ligase beta subunit [Desulfovibrio ferrophilus]
MSKFILEIGTEELPARFFPRLSDDLGKAVEKGLSEALIEYGTVETFTTPRRVVVMVDDVAQTQRSEEELVSGPPRRIAYGEDGQPTKAALGFAKTQNVDIADCFIQETGKGEYLAVKKTMGGGNSIDLLAGICAAAISGLQFPKKMRWGSGDFGFGRPIQWLLALLDEQVVSFELAGVKSGRQTWGHRVHGAGPFDVSTAADYQNVVRDQCKIVLSRDERSETIRKEADELAAAAGGSVVWKESLMVEVVGLVETPVVIMGDFDPSFLEVPREVLLSSMEGHQKSFGVEASDGSLLPHFISTLNLEPKDRSLVKKGWERVLRARLEDARFFWKADLDAKVDDWLASLDNVIYLKGLGSMGDKTRRLETLCGALGSQIDSNLKEDAARAGRLSKADLVSEMVGEFDELQGLMGGIYAEKRGEPQAVADALYQQYLPAGPNSPVPTSLFGAILSMADKADSMAGCFGLGKVPTGANDPYALRRAALGIIRIILAFDLKIDLGELLKAAQDTYKGINWKLEPEEIHTQLMDFFAGRLKAYFTGKGYETLVVEAALGAGFTDLCALARRVEALAEFSRRDDFGQAVLTFKRAANIIIKQGNADGVELTGGYDPTLFEDDQEKALAARLDEIGPTWDKLWAEADFASLLGLLGELRPDVDAFFDGVMVMCEDETLRLNRLNLLQALVSRLGRLADFSALQV